MGSSSSKVAAAAATAKAEEAMVEENAKPALQRGPMGASTNARPKGSYYIDPTSEFMKKWDNFIILLLLFTAVVTPFEVSFLATALNMLFYMNRCVDGGFIVDMFFQFFMGYQNQDNIYIYDYGAIASRYLTGWFPIDFVSILPFDLLSIVMDSNSLQQLKVVRVIRLLRLIKLLRVLRSARIFKRIEHSLGWSYVTFALIKYFVLAMVTIHWVACIWAMAPQLIGDPLNWYTFSGIEDYAAGDKYAAAVEFSLMSLVIGYGAFTPANTAERVVAIICMLLAGGIYAYIIGAICQAVSQRDPGTQKFQQTMDLLNLYMHEIKMPQKDKIRMREFVASCAGLQRQKFYQEVLDVLSPKLRSEFAERTTGQWIRQVPFFCCATPEDVIAENDRYTEQKRFVSDIAMVLHRAAYTRGEMLFKTGEMAECMYIVQQGVIGAKGTILRAGQFCGEDMIMASGRRIYRATAMTFCDTQTLSRGDLYNVLESGDYPETSKEIHIAALRMAIKKYFKQLVATIKSAHALDMGHKRMTEDDIAAWKAEMSAKSSTKRKRLMQKRGSEDPVDSKDDDGGMTEAEQAAARGDPVRAVLQQNKAIKKPSIDKLAKMIDKMYTEVKGVQAGVRNCSDSINELRTDFAKHLGVGGMSPGGRNGGAMPMVADDEMSWRPSTPPMGALDSGKQGSILADLRRASQVAS